MAGAIALTATAALRSGVGYAQVITPGALLPALLQAVPAAMVTGCGGPGRQHLQLEDLPAMSAIAAQADALVVGPGMGAAVGEDLLPALLQGLPASLPTVLDADALNRLAARPGELAGLGENTILTPHPGEAARLLDWPSAAEVQADRPAALTALVESTPAVVVLKGAGTWVGQRGRNAWCNATGNAGMASAGSGDVLSGHLGALLAAGLEPFDAARLAVHLHGLAGDLYAAEWGEDGLTAMDLAQWLGKAMQQWREGAAGEA